jgi:hypothetical protein
MKVGQIEFNAETGEEIFTERELTAKEIKAKEARDKALAAQEELIAKATADKAALLARLGLTEDELKTILG